MATILCPHLYAHDASEPCGCNGCEIDRLRAERDRYRGALESILWQTKDCNGILFKAVQSTAREALNP